MCNLNKVTNILETRCNMARHSFPHCGPLVQSHMGPLVQNHIDPLVQPYWPARKARSVRSCISSVIQNENGKITIFMARETKFITMREERPTGNSKAVCRKTSQNGITNKT